MHSKRLIRMSLVNLNNGKWKRSAYAIAKRKLKKEGGGGAE